MSGLVNLEISIVQFIIDSKSSFLEKTSASAGLQTLLCRFVNLHFFFFPIYYLFFKTSMNNLQIAKMAESNQIDQCLASKLIEVIF